MDSTAPLLPAKAPPGASAVRQQMAAATRRIARLKRIDRAAVGVITLGGVAIIVAVLGILVFIAAEALPLFRAATITPFTTVPVRTSIPPADAAAFGAIGTDEYLKYVYAIQPAGALLLTEIGSGEVKELPVPGVRGATVTATSHSVLNNFVAAGLSDGRLSLMQIRFTPVFTEQTVTDVTVNVVDRSTIQIDAKGRPVREVSYDEHDGQKFVAGLVDTSEIAYWWTDAEGGEHRQTLTAPAGERITRITVGRGGNLIAGTEQGHVFHWEVGDELMLADTSMVSTASITALEWLIGGHSYIAGDRDGRVSSWFMAPTGENGDPAMVRAHVFAPQGSAITNIAVSPRDRTFATASANGSIVLRHQTSERTLAAVHDGEPIAQLAIAPRANALLVERGDQVQTYVVRNPHPEVSPQVLFGKVWYEGYSQPEYVWQSTGATDDFEAKLSLVPLIFGTIKGTFYALIFAIPLAVFGALYTSQFVHPSIRAKIKPAVEIMAALPSVVIGFLAGLYLATLVERNLAAVFLSYVLLPLFGTAGVFLWRVLPQTLIRRLAPGSEVFVIIPLLLVGAALAFAAGPFFEVNVLGTDTRQWLLDTFGLTYDQRNCLVVGLAMGFAVIPIIFTISEDAFSSVPAALTAASLALGASRWQTATRVVLPTASPGIFSAIMVGFGRAVGETMIVLMATGNTPIMDWSIFNGMRTLSANIAVEIPEAPHSGTLYRVLFLAAALLFVLTFAVNTIAEVVRQRLRDRYKAV